MGRDEAAGKEWLERHNRVVRAKKEGDIGYLIRVLEDPEQATTAARYLRKLRAVEAIDPLIRALDSQDHNLRIDAIHALQEIGGTQAAERLRQVAVEDEHEHVRLWAASVLAAWRAPGAFELLVPHLQQPRVLLRGHAAFSLGKLADPRGVEPLRESRPTLFRAPLEWRVWGSRWRRAIRQSKRAAAGKRPQRWLYSEWFSWIETIASVAAFVAGVMLLWMFASFWWALALLVFVVCWWFLPNVWLVLREKPWD